MFLRGQADDDEAADPEKVASEHSPLFWKPVLLTVGGLAAMAVGGPAVVEGALRLTQATELSQDVVGATIVSLGTGAEMIALGVSAARKKASRYSGRRILGSFAYNLLVTLGLAAAIHALPVDPHMIVLAIPVMVLAHLLLLTLIWYGKIPRLVEGLLVGVYLAYLLAVVRV